MSVFVTILLSILAIVLIIGLIRVMFSPYDGFINLLMEMMLIDWLIDGLALIFETISDIWSD